MSRFRTKSLVVEAEQWFPGNGAKGVRDDHPVDAKAYSLCGCRLIGLAPRGPHVHPARTLSPVSVEPGDWIIASPDGISFYPCKPDLFAATYEATSDD
jgi:hypothetical protein